MKIPYIKGRELDNVALLLGLKRKTFWFIFKESDKKLRKRLSQRVSDVCNSNLIPIRCRRSGI